MLDQVFKLQGEEYGGRSGSNCEGFLRDQLSRRSRRQRRTIDAVRDERIENIRKRHNPGAERDSFTLEPVGIAAAIELLVMASDDRSSPPGAAHAEACSRRAADEPPRSTSPRA